MKMLHREEAEAIGGSSHVNYNLLFVQRTEENPTESNERLKAAFIKHLIT